MSISTLNLVAIIFFSFMRRLVFGTQYFRRQERYFGRISCSLCPALLRYGTTLVESTGCGFHVFYV